MKFIRTKLKIITIIFIFILLIILIVLKVYLNKEANEEIKEEVIKEDVLIKEEPIEPLQIETVHIDIKGAVANPGVYEIDSTKKVIDVVNAAGGLTDQADTSMINLAKKVTNEMVIIIYTKEEVKKYNTKDEIIKVVDKECICPEIKNDACINNNTNNTLDKNTNETNKENTTTNQTTPENITQSKINLNTATLEELQNLNGIGEGKAKLIIEYREENGRFNSIEEIKEVSGIGESLYEKIKDNITI